MRTNLLKVVLLAIILSICLISSHGEKKEKKAGKTMTNDEFQAMQAEQAREKEESDEREKAEKKEKAQLRKLAKKSGEKEVKKKKNTKDWSKITENDLEKDWEDGDDEEELEHEYEHSQRIAKKVAERKEKENQEQMKKMNMGDSNNPDNIQKMLRKKAKEARKSGGINVGGGGLGGMLNGGTGTAMYFTDLVATIPTGKNKGNSWTKLVLDDLCGKWSSMLRSAHLGANIYSVDANAKEGQVLVAIDKPWQTSDILRYLLHQPEITKMSKDSKDYTKQMFPEDDDDDDDDNDNDNEL